MMENNTHNDGEEDTNNYEYVSYVSPKTIMTETVYHFLRGSVYGVAYGMVTPFYEIGSKGALLEAKTGIFKPAPYFACMSSIPSHAIFIGSILGAQRFFSKSLEYSRGKADYWNDTFGYCMIIPYYQLFLTKYAVQHNRIVGGTIMAAIAFANL